MMFPEWMIENESYNVMISNAINHSKHRTVGGAVLGHGWANRD
jgi:hypothetical protein